MHLKNSCRLCLNKKGEFYDLFCSNQEEVTLADELTSLLNFQLIKKEHLPESICSNCYKINCFFREFKRKCAQVNDYINRLYESQESPIGDITMRTEKYDNYADDSIGDPRKSRSDVITLGEGNASTSDDPVALLSLSYDENLDELRSNFICGQGLRDDVTAKLIMQNGEQTGDISSDKEPKRLYEEKSEYTSPEFILSRVKIEMCCDEDSEVQIDCPDRMANSEDKSNHEPYVRKDMYTGDCLRIGENIHDYGSHLFSGSALSEPYQPVNEYGRIHPEIPKDSSELCARRRQQIVPELDNKNKSTKVEELNPLPVGVQIKHEGVDMYENPMNDLRSGNSTDQQYLPDQSYLSYSINNYQSPSLGLTTLYLQMGGNHGMHYPAPTEDWSCRVNGQRKERYRRITNEQRRAHALRQARNRANETPEQRERRRRANAERNALRRANMTPEQLQKSRQEHAQRERERRRRLKDARRNRTVLIDRFNKVIKKALETQEDPT